ncbi:hypothetical protein CQA86_23120 [Klebsiella pneumoniae]|nr:hypothetical protein CQA86_23120 [Klebsiella pneumoniae]
MHVTNISVSQATMHSLHSAASYLYTNYENVMSQPGKGFFQQNDPPAWPHGRGEVIDQCLSSIDM